MKYPRVPFQEAIDEPLLLKRAWLNLSRPQQSALRIFYGLPLDEDGLRDYAMFTERAKYDELGYVSEVQPADDYTQTEHDEGYVIFGRRSHKTGGFLAFILVYEALLGGHTEFASKKQQVASFIVAQKLDIAQAIIRDFIEPIVSSSKLLEKEIVKNNIEGILFKNGHIIKPAPPVIKNFRYFAIPVAALDEASFWYKDAESANPDYEVIRAVEPAQGQFPYRKLVAGSTMWTKEGIIWESLQAGMYGRKLQADDDRRPRWKHAMVLTAPTPAMQNPLLARSWFERQFIKDPDAYKREILNQAADFISGMFSELLINTATDNAPHDRPYCEKWFYVATLDPAFRGDDFAFTIGHYERGVGFVQDVLKKWTPETKQKLNPATILDEIKVYLDQYHLEMTYSDQYQLESLQQLALDRGFSIIGQDFTANSKSKMFGSFLQLLRNKRVHLVREHEQSQQFLIIQKTVGHGGYVRVAAPVGKHDDLVTVTVMCANMAIRFESAGLDEDEKKFKVMTPFEQVMDSIAKKKEEEKGEWL